MRSLGLMIAAVVAVSVLSGCGGSGPSATDPYIPAELTTKDQSHVGIASITQWTKWALWNYERVVSPLADYFMADLDVAAAKTAQSIRNGLARVAIAYTAWVMAKQLGEPQEWEWYDEEHNVHWRGHLYQDEQGNRILSARGFSGEGCVVEVVLTSTSGQGAQATAVGPALEESSSTTISVAGSALEPVPTWSSSLGGLTLVDGKWMFADVQGDWSGYVDEEMETIQGVFKWTGVVQGIGPKGSVGPIWRAVYDETDNYTSSKHGGQVGLTQKNGYSYYDEYTGTIMESWFIGHDWYWARGTYREVWDDRGYYGPSILECTGTTSSGLRVKLDCTEDGELSGGIYQNTSQVASFEGNLIDGTDSIVWGPGDSEHLGDWTYDFDYVFGG